MTSERGGSLRAAQDFSIEIADTPEKREAAYRLSGIHFMPLGPAIEYRGLRQPSWNRLDDILGRMRRERPAAWDYVTDGGALWPEAAEAAAAAA